jgi:hypothetical protein
MRKGVPKYFTHFIIFSALLSAACDDRTNETKRDGGPADGPAKDGLPTDSTTSKDTANPDTQADKPLSTDLKTEDVAQDTNKMDIPLPLDVPISDVPLHDEGINDGGVDSENRFTDALKNTLAYITFRFKNTGTQAVYLRSECNLPIQVTSTADGTEYFNQPICACSCADPGCMAQVQCAPCAPPSGTLVESDHSQDIPWAARKSSMQTKAGINGAFQCVAHAPIPTGLYQVSVQVYPTMADAKEQTHGKAVSMTFPLTTASTTVEVPIQSPAP